MRPLQCSYTVAPAEHTDLTASNSPEASSKARHTMALDALKALVWFWIIDET